MVRGMKRLVTKYTYYLRSIWLLLIGFADPLQTVRIFSPVAGPGLKTVRLREGGLRFSVRGATDVWSVKETFLDRFYERYGFEIEPGWTVFDIGAGIGELSIFAAQAQPDTRVFAFEPAPASSALLRENIRLNDLTNVQVLEVAIGAESGTMLLDTSGGDPLMYSSRTERDVAGAGEFVVKSMTLQDAMAWAGVGQVDLLKLDCEGAEYDILYSADRSVLARIPRIVMEFHDLDGERTHVGLRRYLEDAGYVVETFSNPVHGWTGFLRAWRR